MIINKDCLEALKELPDNSIDSIVTDPPAGISFMNKSWDDDKGGRDNWIAWMQEIATECHRVLKPGGHGLVWSIPRTSHWTAMAWENAGFEIRDNISHVFGSGFPKSLNIGKAVDKLQGNERDVIGITPAGKGIKSGGGNYVGKTEYAEEHDITKGTSEWEGWGTALKPAREDWWLIRKPIEKGLSIAENCLKWGVGGINIDGSRVEGTYDNEGRNIRQEDYISESEFLTALSKEGRKTRSDANSLGRFPANLIHDGSEEVLGLFPNTVSKWGKSSGVDVKAENCSNMQIGLDGEGIADRTNKFTGDSGSAARFFYCAKAPANQRWSYLTCNCQTVKLDTWQKQDQNQKEKMDGTSPEVDISENYITEDSDSNMTLFGNNTMDQSHQNTTSTTLMETNSTTTSQTSNLSHQQNTSESMEDVNLKMGNGINHVNSVQSENQLQQIFGTSQKKDGHSTGVAVPATLAKLYTKSVCEKCGSQVRNTAHPTQKPIKLMEYLVNLVSKEGHTVLDPFAGSGTTGIACKKLNRNFIGIERDEEYCKIAEARINNLTLN